MQIQSIIYLMALLLAFGACSNDNGKSREQKKAEEQVQRNPIQKSRYVCYYLSATGDKIAPELYMLSDNIYQFNDTTGHYKFHSNNSVIEWIDGPLRKAKDNWLGVYTPKGSVTKGGGQTLETMIEIQAGNTTDSLPTKLMHCNCAEFE